MISQNTETTRRQLFLWGSAGVMTALLSKPSMALVDRQAVKLIIGFPPGGPVDIVGRLVADQLGSLLGRPVIADNRPGAGGAIGAEIVARSKADGLTLGIAPVSCFSIAPAAGLKLPYRVPEDFTFISMLAKLGGVILARSDASFNNLQDMLEKAKVAPGKLSYASSGLGTSSHLSGEYLSQLAGITMTHVPYKGTAPAVQDLLGGQVDVYFETSQHAASSLVAAGKLKAIALTGSARSVVLPGIRTVSEQGFSGFDVSPWMGLVGPAQLPVTLVSALNDACIRALSSPLVIAKIANLGGVTETSTPEAFRQFVEQDTRRWSTLIQKSGIQLQSSLGAQRTVLY